MLAKYYQGLDATSVLLGPFTLDWVSDGAGLLLASHYQDGPRKVVYATALTIPLAGAALLNTVKAFKEGKLALKRGSDGNLYLVDDEALEFAKEVTSNYQRTVIKSNKNIFENINWKNNIQGHLSNTNAVEFWQASSKEYKHYIDNDLYVKYDDKNGLLLLSDTKRKEIVGFYEGKENIDIVNQVGLQKITEALKTVHGLSGGKTSFKVISKTGEIITVIPNPNKTTIVLGSWIDGTGDLIEFRLSMLKNSDFGNAPGRIQMLNVDKDIIDLNGGYPTFWEKFNKVFLDYGINNPSKYDFSLCTRPSEQVLFRVNRGTGIKELSGFGKEIKTLIENNVQFVNFNGNLIELKSLLSKDLLDTLLKM